MSLHHAAHLAPRHVPRPFQAAPPLGRTDRLHLLLALGSALTGTTLGVGMALVVLALVAVRVTARRHLAVSVAAGRGVLTPAQRAQLLDPAGQPAQPVARP